MKILLIGKNGQVGWELQRALSTLGDVVAVDFFDKELCGDLTNLEGIAQTVRTVRPDVVVNAAAHTAVDKAESERELSDLLNDKGWRCWRRVGEAGCADGALLHGLCV
jgi:dTDP-4-dehydrorhamnose reductase